MGPGLQPELKLLILKLKRIPCNTWACDLENNGIIFCEEVRWNCEWAFLFLEYSVSEKRGIICILQQNAHYCHEHTKLCGWGTYRNWVPNVPYRETCALHRSQHQEPVKAARSPEIGYWRWWMADLWIPFQFFNPKKLQYLLLPSPFIRKLPVIPDNR